MYSLNFSATAIFEKIIALDKLKFENSGGTFMAVSFECIQTFNDDAKIYSMAHYYEQNGDLMADPEMTFLKYGREIFPLSYRLDGLGIDDLAAKIFFENEKLKGSVNLKKQKELKVFAQMWLKNIKQQQEL